MSKKKKTMHPRGTDHHNAKLCEREVKEIRREYHKGQASIGWLAKEYGVSRGTIADIVRGRTWA